jgi:putative hydrolase
MAIWGDYHTHTRYSHGTGTVEENVQEAIKKGLKEIAITDHGFRHVMFNVRRSVFHRVIADVEEARKKYPQINIYLGLETNLVSRKGGIDLMEGDLPMLDMVVCGYHKLVNPDIFADYWKIFIPNMFESITKKTSLRVKNRNTDMYIRAIERHDIDILSHPNNGINADVIEVVKACKFYGTYMELNGKGNYMTDKELEKLIGMGVQFIANSDAHEPERVGEISKPLQIIERVGIPYEQIGNWEKLPKFRSRIKKNLYE